MLRSRFIVRVCILGALLYGIYCIRSQYTFQTFLDNVKIGFDDFPVSYAQALNDSVAQGKQPLDYDYNATFTAVKIPRKIHYIWFKNLYQSREGVTEIPSLGSRSPELCRQHNPSFEIRMWNQSTARAFLAEEYNWFLPT